MSATAVAAETPTLTFPAGIPGFPDSEQFVLSSLGDETPFMVLRPHEGERPEFVVVPPMAFFPEYAPEIDDQMADALELTSADDALLLVVVNVGGGVGSATANLLGPIVVNRRTRRAAQVILTNSGFDVRTPLFNG